VTYHVPPGVDLAGEAGSDTGVKAAAQGLLALPYLSTILPVGGAGDRLGLRWVVWTWVVGEVVFVDKQSWACWVGYLTRQLWVICSNPAACQVCSLQRLTSCQSIQSQSTLQRLAQAP
jgi:hypothetical protein